MIKHFEKNDNFEELTKARCLIDFYADWCGPCKMMGALLENLDSSLGIPIIKINTDEHPELSTKMGIMSIPTLILMENSREVAKHVGYMSEDELKKFIA